jgi:glycosyltransferase involved in cell wall biosynthesis
VILGNQFADLDAQHQTFLSLVDAAERDQRAGRLELAAVRAQIAGCFAWMNPCGIFASQQLEDLLIAVGATIRTPAVRREPPRRNPRTVLHVATQMYQTGGSTQGVTSWIEQDRERTHRVVLTRQSTSDAPAKLMSALRSPADLLRLDCRAGGLLGRAAALRRAAIDCDVVVLHAHPYDVIPVLAFGGPIEHPPLISVDHADHVFWLGVSVAQTLMSMRDSGAEVAITRRGISPSRCRVMARPLRLRERTLSRAEAKQRLSLDPQQLIILTAADASKYRPIADVSFLKLLGPVVERHPDVVLLAAGASADDDWRAASQRAGGRIHALGRLPDVSLLQQAADLYVDSFPFASLTSLLETGALGTPVLSFRGHPPDCRVLGADTRGVDDYLVTSDDPRDFQQQISGLIADRSRRERLGQLTGAEIRSSHTGGGWRAQVDSLYEFASEQPSPAAVAVPPRRPGELDVLVDLVMKRTGLSDGAVGAVARNAALLPLPQRLASWISLTKQGRSPGLTRLLPEWLHPRLSTLRNRLHRIFVAGVLHRQPEVNRIG